MTQAFQSFLIWPRDLVGSISDPLYLTLLNRLLKSPYTTLLLSLHVFMFRLIFFFM